MTRHRRILLVIVFLVAASIAWWWSNQARDTVVRADAQKGVAPPPRGAPAVRSSTNTPAASGSKREAIREVLSTLNHQPIEFYGKVIDQYGAPVVGAEVNAQIIYNTGLASGVKKPTTLTDSNGYFAFTGFMGRTLDFNITKTGYQFTPEGDAFDYTRLVAENKRHHPDSKHPVTLRMWKLQGAEALIQGGKRLDIFPDGKPVRIDFATGKVVDHGGDLIINLKHEQQQLHNTPKWPYDWIADIASVEGGITEVNQRIGNMLFAPEDGYVPAVRIQMPATRADWKQTDTKNFFAKSRGSFYSRLVVKIECTPDQSTSCVQVNWWLNPSGSRNLEYDPAKRIEPK